MSSNLQNVRNTVNKSISDEKEAQALYQRLYEELYRSGEREPFVIKDKISKLSSVVNDIKNQEREHQRKFEGMLKDIDNIHVEIDREDRRIREELKKKEEEQRRKKEEEQQRLRLSHEIAKEQRRR